MMSIETDLAKRSLLKLGSFAENKDKINRFNNDICRYKCTISDQTEHRLVAKRYILKVKVEHLKFTVNLKNMRMMMKMVFGLMHIILKISFINSSMIH